MVDPLPGISAAERTANTLSCPESDSLNQEVRTKRRKVRKGTRSCWECKRRKTKCIFASSEDAACIGCIRRRTDCVSQEMPEELSPARKGNRFLGERITRVEDFMKDFMSSKGASVIDQTEEDLPQYRHSKFDTPTARTDDSESTTIQTHPTHSANQYEPAANSPILTSDSQGVSTQADTEIILQHLFAAFPSEEDVKILLRESSRTSRYNEIINTQPYSKLTRETLAEPYLEAKLPHRNTHPVLLAKFMLTIAITLQIPRRDKFLDLSEPPNMIKRRLMAAVTMWVTTREEMQGTLESLFCIILEGVFETNCGNLRRAWGVYRRAMTAAQLMGLHRTPMPSLKRIDLELDVKPEMMWFRIVHMDRYLSLLLGLPQGTSDKSMGALAVLRNEAPLGRFERLLTAIASRILERNESPFTPNELAVTQSIDAELLEVSTSMPAKFWRPANFHSLTPGEPDAFLETLRLGAQVYYYGLLIQLHLPYMVRIGYNSVHEYAKITCVNAGREILTRFIAHRSFNPMSSCSRPVDFFALLAAMTLLLAHLDAHYRREGANFLAHQRLSDRALLDEVLERMEAMSKFNEDLISEQSARLVRRLLDIEVDAAQGSNYAARSVDGDGGVQQGENGEELRLNIPYIGIIKITREGPISREPSHCHTSQAQVLQATTVPSFNDELSSLSNAPIMDGQPLRRLHNLARSPANSEYEQSMLQYQYSNYGIGPTQPPTDLPPIAGDADDWAFQGVDMAFFDSLMRGTSHVGTGGLDQEWIEDPIGIDSGHAQ